MDIGWPLADPVSDHLRMIHGGEDGAEQRGSGRRLYDAASAENECDQQDRPCERWPNPGPSEPSSLPQPCRSPHLLHRVSGAITHPPPAGAPAVPSIAADCALMRRIRRRRSPGCTCRLPSLRSPAIPDRQGRSCPAEFLQGSFPHSFGRRHLRRRSSWPNARRCRCSWQDKSERKLRSTPELLPTGRSPLPQDSEARKQGGRAWIYLDASGLPQRYGLRVANDIVNAAILIYRSGCGLLSSHTARSDWSIQVDAIFMNGPSFIRESRATWRAVCAILHLFSGRDYCFET